MLEFLFKFFYSLFSLLLAIFFIALGLLFILLPFSSMIRYSFIDFILENSIAISLFGFGFVIVGGSLIATCCQMLRRHDYLVKSDQPVKVDEKIIQHYLESYWAQKFPNNSVPTTLNIKKNKIKIFADLPYMPIPDRHACLENIQQDLISIFKNVLGYSQDFRLSISFQKLK